MKIKVQYPDEIALGFLDSDFYEKLGVVGHKLHKHVSQSYNVKVDILNKSEPKLSNDELCKLLTGMTPSEYQLKNHRSWCE